MKTTNQALYLTIVLLIISLSNSVAQTIKTIGADGDYATLNVAIADVQNGTLTGEIIFSITSDIIETATTYIRESGVANWDYSSITIRPSGDARKVNANIANPILSVIGSNNGIVIDGRVDGTGSSNQLSFTNGSGPAITIDNYYGIENVTLKYLNLEGVTESTTAGIVNVLSHAASSTAGITIDNCKIGNPNDVATNGVYAKAYSSGYIEATIQNCEILNVWHPEHSSKGISVNEGCEGWTISSNSIYQTSTRTATAANTHYGVYVNAGNGHNISNNNIGGSEPQCGGNAWTIIGEYANKFIGIYLNVGTTAPASVNGSVISNFNHTYHSTASAITLPGIWCGIYLYSGDANIGTDTGNTIGTITGTDDIAVNSNAPANAKTIGIGVNSTGSAVNVSNNLIGGLTLNATSTNNGHSFTGIQNSAANDITVHNNTIGSTSIVNSIIATNPNESDTNEQNIRGIENSANATITISYNTIANMSNSCVRKGDVVGIYSDKGVNKIVGNSISMLANASGYNHQYDKIYNVTAGISLTSNLDEQLVNRNTIYNLSNSFDGYYETIVSGIVMSDGSGTISQNTIYNISFAYEHNSLGNGIWLLSDCKAMVMNNAIRLGVGEAHNNKFVGIQSYSSNTILGNSVYIGGTATNDSYATYAYRKDYWGTDKVYNNIFYNARASESGYSEHYAIGKSTGSSLESDFNNLYSQNPDAVASTNVYDDYYPMGSSSLAQWQTATGGDANSLSIDPQFIGAEDAIPDLHISASSPMINMGTSVYPLVVDIDDDIRDQLPDIGCDEFYTGSVVVGEGQTYTTLKAAFDAINAGDITGNISINIQSSTTETATATLYQSGYNGTSDYTSVSVGTASENITVSGNIAAPIVSFNGAHDVNMVNLTIKNENSDGYCILLTNSASNNRIAGCNLLGVTQLTNKGLITFGDAGSGTGNNNNIIENCIFSNNTSKYQYGVVSAGTASVGNNDNTISESKFNNFWSSGNSSAGIYLDENNSNWNISNNHLYQTEAITATGGNAHFGIQSLSTNNINISNNYIGGTSEECGGTAWTVSGSYANNFTSIYISGENSGESTVSGNTISNFSWTTAPEANMYEGVGVWTAIAYGGGIIDITDNTIGAFTGTNNIAVETTTNYHVASYGIKGGIDGANVTISGNAMGSVDVSTVSVDYSHNFTGIQNNGATEVTISNNLIGSNTTAKSINTSTECNHSATGQHLAGIVNRANTTTCHIESNTIKNLHNSTVSFWSSFAGSPFGHMVIGIAATNGTNTIVGNTISNLSTTSFDSRIDQVIGIYASSDKPGQVINSNTILGLNTIATDQSTKLSGIRYKSPESGTNQVSGNRIYGITSSVSSATTPSEIKGIHSENGKATVFFNNMISLGSTVTNGHSIFGILSWTRGSFYYNSVAVTGNVVGALNGGSSAFKQDWASSEVVVMNNIFLNTRTNSSQNNNFAFYLNNPGSAEDMTLDYNAYWVNGTGTVLGYDGTSGKTELPIINGKDANSINTEVTFTNTANADLHTSTAAINAMAVPIPSITTDFDGNTRNPLHPDMGADEFIHPVIPDLGSGLDFGWTDVLSPTNSQSYNLKGIDLTANMVVTAPVNFQVSLNSEENFSQSVSIVPVNTNVETTIYTRFLPNVEGFSWGFVNNSSSGVQQTKHVQGSAHAIPPVMETGSVTNLSSETADCNAEIVHTGGRSVINRGVIYWPYNGEDKVIGDTDVLNKFEEGTFEAENYSMAIVELDINTRFNYRAHANNGEWDFGGIGYGETADFWTLATTPTIPITANITGSTVDVEIAVDQNPAYTQYAIHETTTNRFVQADGSMNTNPVWQTKAEWGAISATLYNFQNLTGNREYTLEVKARNGANVETGYSESVTILTLANTPNIMWVGNITGTSVDISVYTYSSDYSNNSATTLYKVLENNSGLFVQTDGTLGITPAWNTRDDWYNFTIIDLSIGSEYSLSSIAKNDAGTETDPGPELIFYTLAAVPGSPSIEDVTSSTASITINPGTNPVNIEYLISVSNGKIVQTDGSLATSAAWQTKADWDGTVLQGLTPNTNLSFSVKARNGDNVETIFGDETSILTLANIPGSPTVNVYSWTNQLEFYIAQNNNPSSTEYAVQDEISGLYVKNDGYLGELPVWKTSVNWQTSPYILGLAPGTEYSIRTKARNASSIETDWGGSTVLSTIANTPGLPIASNITESSVDIEVDTNENPENVTYALFENNANLYIQVDGSFDANSVWQTATDWGIISLTGFEPNQNISVKAKAKNNDDTETEFSAPKSLHTSALVPAAPTVEVLSSTNVSIVVNTNENPNTVFYAIQEVTTGQFVNFYNGLWHEEDWRRIEYWNNLNVGGLEQLTEYIFRVKARNGDYVETAYGPEVSVTTHQGLPSAPTLLAPGNYVADQQIPVTFSWEEIEGATSYEIEYSIYANFYTENHSITGITDLLVEASDLNHSYTYYWHVRATNAVGTGPWSDRWQFTTIAGPPAIPTLVYPSNGSSNQALSVLFHWNQVNMASGYSIQVSTDDSFTELFADISDYEYLYYTLDNLDGNTTYYWRVSASNSYGLSDWSEVWWFTTISGTNVISNSLLEVSVYPNPVDNILYISGIDNENPRVSIITNAGVEILNIQLSNNYISTYNLLPGTYILRIKFKQGVVIKRFVKQ